MIFQWVVTVALTPFLLLPLFPRQSVGFQVRLIVVAAAFMVSGLMTVIYLRERRRSRHAASTVVTVTAALDVALVFAALIAWPNYVPDLFWVFTIVVIVLATRLNYRWTIAVTLGLSALYAVTLVARVSGTVQLRTLVGDTLIRIVFLLLIAVAIVYVTERNRRERSDISMLSRIAGALGSTLDLDAMLQIVVDGVGMAAGGERATVFLASTGSGDLRARSTSETDPDARARILASAIAQGRMDRMLGARPGEPVVIDNVPGEPFEGLDWPGDREAWACLLLPLGLEDGARGLVIVERRVSRRPFTEREISLSRSILEQAEVGIRNALRYSDVQAKRAESEKLYLTLRELGSTIDLSEVAETACSMAIRATGATSSTLFLLEEGKGLLYPRMAVESSGFHWGEFTAGSEIGIEALEDELLRSGSGRPLLIERPEDSEILPSFLKSEGTALVAPLFSGDSVEGMLCVTDKPDKRFSREQISSFAVVAGETGLVITNARLHERITFDAAQLSSLMQLANAIGSTADLNAIIAIALDTVRHLFEASAGLVYALDEETGSLRYVDSFGYPVDVMEKLSARQKMPPEECTAIGGGLISAGDLSTASLGCRTLERLARGSAVCVEMKAEGKTLGVLHIRSDRPGAFNDNDIQMVGAIADQVALALQRALLFDEISRLAITDPLTGVFNVRRLDSVLQDEVARTRRYLRPVSFLMIDIDNLKAYNDRLGHQQGDSALVAVAAVLDTNTRNVDKVFRYGGDEFCILLPETDYPEAMVVAEKVRHAVSSHRFPGESKVPGGSLTISVGVASFPRDAADPDELVRKADLALYEAKQQGRNRVGASG